MILQTPDTTLIDQVLSGRRERFNVLVRRYLASVYAVAYAQVHNHADAEDVAQEAFLQAYQRLDTLRERRKFEGWVTSIARNLAVSLTRRRKREREAQETLAQNEPAPKSPGLPGEMEELLAREVEGLQPGLREALTLHYFAGRKTKDIAALMDLSEEAVRKRLQRGREELGERLLAALAKQQDTAKERTHKLERRIATLVAAATVSWTAATSTTTAASATAFFSTATGKAVAAGCVCLCVAGTAWIVSANNAEPDDEFLITQGPSTSPSTTDTAEPEPPQTAQTASTTPPAAQEPADPDEPELDEPTEETYTDPTGIWHALLHEPLPDNSFFYAEALIEYDGDKLTLHLSDAPIGEEPDTKEPYIGSLDGLRMVLERHHTSIRISGTPVETTLKAGSESSAEEYEFQDAHVEEEYTASYTLVGTFDPEYTTFLGEVYSNSSPTTPGKLELLRLTPEEHVMRETAQLAHREVKRAATAIYRWADREERWPGPDEAEVVYRGAFIKNGIEREIKYKKPVKISTNLPNVPSLGHVMTGAWRPDLSISDRMVTFESLLTEAWGDDFANTGPWLTISYPETGLVAEAINSKKVNFPGIKEKYFRRLPQMLAKVDYTLRESCMNNLKQLGLSMKMFENEVQDEICPPGWRSMYPEYLPDRAVLRCPTDPHGTISYEIVLSAANAAYLYTVHAEIHGISPEEAEQSLAAMSEIPWVYETDLCASEPGNPGRNVIFMDGHVEFLPEEAVQDLVGPFLAYR